MSDSVFSLTVTSPVPVTQSSNEIDEWVDSFFTPNLKETDQPDITHYSTQHFNPTALNFPRILEHCKETYSQVLEDHFEKNAIGGSIPFLHGSHLQRAICDALNKAMEECEVLMKISYFHHRSDLKDPCRDRIKAKLEAICGAFKKRNEDRRFHFITKNAKSMMTGFAKSLEKSCSLLHCEIEPEKLNNDRTLNRRPIPHERFYEHQQMSKFVGDMTNDTIVKCDAFINKMEVPPNESLNRVCSDDGFKLLEHIKMSIRRYGEDLLAKNARHQKMTADYIDNLISTEFEEKCINEVKKMSFPGGNDIKAVILNVKEDIHKEIRKVLCKNSVDTENSSMLESEYHGKLEIMEAVAFKACLIVAAVEAEKSIKCFLFKMEDVLNPDKAVVWISRLAEESGVPDNYVTIVKNNLMTALQRMKEDCLGTDILSERSSAYSEDATGCSMDHKSNVTSVKQNDVTRSSDNGKVDMEQVIPRPSGSSTSRKHKSPPIHKSHNKEYSSEKRNSEKRGRLY